VPALLLQFCDGNPTVFQREVRLRRLKKLFTLVKLRAQIKSSVARGNPDFLDFRLLQARPCTAVPPSSLLESAAKQIASQSRASAKN
jgi:hypothetical protein